MPVPKRGTSIASMSFSDSTGAVCARLLCICVCDMRFRPAVSTCSVIVFQALQSVHWPVQRLATAPQSLQTKLVRGLAMVPNQKIGSHPSGASATRTRGARAHINS